MPPVRAVALAALFATASVAAAQQPAQPQPRPGPKTWDQVTDAAVAYLKTTQADDGSWSKATHPGITGVVLTGLFKSGKVPAADPLAAKGLTYVEGMADAKTGHLAVARDDLRHKFYVTTINLQALKSSGDKKYDTTVAAAVKYLTGGQFGSDDGKKQDDPNFGGFGYGPGTRGDMSNTHFALDALVLAGLPKDDPAFKRAAVFVSRCQNLKSEQNDQPWADKINDGSFVYVLGGGGGPPREGTTPPPADAAKPGYGSMTYAGLKSLVLCGVSRDDPRCKKAVEWVSKNYSVDVNPGRAEGAGGQGYFYYLVSMARCLDTLGIDEVTDAAGKKHDWRADITRALANRQKPNGSWANDFATWMETNPDLDTAYALIALSYTRPKAK
jgi:squalene-hopene/tetraprenyl-beta-curcumene cyclase